MKRFLPILILSLTALCFPIAAFAAVKSYTVPSVGYAVEWQMKYTSLEGSELLSGPQRIHVSRMLHHRPVFSAALAGRPLELFEHADGVAVVELDCLPQFTPISPTSLPNHCGWNPCSINAGETVMRKLYVSSSRMGCVADASGYASYVGEAQETITVLGRSMMVTRTLATINIPGLPKARWNPRIASGVGEVFSDAFGGRQESVYIKIDAVYANIVVEGGALHASAAPITESVARSSFACTLSANEHPVVALGDSLTAGTDASSYPAELQKQYTGKGVRFLNAGVQGDTSENLLERVASVLLCKPKLVLLAVGGNDLFQGVARAVFEERLRALIAVLRAGGASVVLLGLEVDSTYPYAGSYERIAREAGIPILPNMLLGVYKNNAMLLSDGMHPNERGNKHIAARVWEFLDEQGLLKF